MTSLLILADDLTGAADCANACRRLGMPASALLNPLAGMGCLSNAGGNMQAVALDANSRNLRPALAADLHRRILRRHLTPSTPLYKKVDSTLRGNVGAEIAATIRLAGIAILAPAFPATGRRTVAGQQQVHGTAVSETEIWRNIGLSGTADIVQMMRAEGLQAVGIPLSCVRQSTASLREQFLASARAGTEVLVCDAEAASDLQAIARASSRLPAPHFWAGSAGLMEYVAATLIQAGKASDIALPAATGRVLTVVGSMSEICANQVRQLNEQRAVQLVSASSDTLAAGEAHPDWLTLRDSLTAALRSGDVMIAVSGDSRLDPASGSLLCLALGRLIAPHAAGLAAIIATGGETARAVLDAVGITALRLAGEVEEGVPISLGTGARPLVVITKAGAFGDTQTLVRCYDALRH